MKSLAITNSNPPPPPPLLKKQSPPGSFSPNQLNNIDQGGVGERVVTGQIPRDGGPPGNKG